MLRRRRLLTVLAVLLLGACGKKGPLRLPEDEEALERRRGY